MEPRRDEVEAGEESRADRREAAGEPSRRARAGEVEDVDAELGGVALRQTFEALPIQAESIDA